MLWRNDDFKNTHKLPGGRVRGISRITAHFRRYFARLRAVFARFHVPYRRVIATITRKPADCTVAEMRDFANTSYTKLVIILARTLLERIGVNYGGILVNSISRFHAQFRSFAYYVRNFADAIFDAFCA